MRKGVLAVAVFVGALPGTLPAGTLQIVPTTTLQAQTFNNTSAANSFQSQTNGNLGATNVSKVNMHSLLYPGNRTKIYAHLMPWFGDPRHMSVGYNSQDPAQIHRQIRDMISRGIDGVIIDWYGSRDTFTNTTTLRVMMEAEQHPGFKFAIMIDKGAIKLSACSGCTPQQTLIEQLRYVEQTFVPSPAYLRIDGRPLITNFDVELHYPSINWSAAAASATTDPVFIFEDASGFTHAVTGGSYSWVRPSTTDFGMTYLTGFYSTGLGYPALETIGASYKGFNDTLASWGLNRIMTQRCSHTWLQTFAKINSLYNSTKQLDALQLPTWNDYEEGTEIETGIDNCMSFSASLSGNTLQWTVSGYEDTLDHYRVFISTDGQHLMPLTTMAVGSRSLNLCSYTLEQRSYVLFVEALGRPTIRNRMSRAIAYTPHCSAGTASVNLARSFTGVTSGVCWKISAVSKLCSYSSDRGRKQLPLRVGTGSEPGRLGQLLQEGTASVAHELFINEHRSAIGSHSKNPFMASLLPNSLNDVLQNKVALFKVLQKTGLKIAKQKFTFCDLQILPQFL